MADTELLVVGAGPYAYSAAAYARERGIGTRIVGRPMGFWRDQMPADMYLRSGRDWSPRRGGRAHLRRLLRGARSRPADHDPIPIGVFLDHTEWFAEQKRLGVEEVLVDTLTRADGHFEATMSDGSTITAEKVLAAPASRTSRTSPQWYADVPADRRSHTSELVSFDDLAGARVAVIGGRQSAYEWAALLCDHGAERVDVVHRHDTPVFARVSWEFVDPYVDQTLAHRGWWRDLPPRAAAGDRAGVLAGRPADPGALAGAAAAARRRAPATPRARSSSVEAGDASVTLTLSDGDRLEVDHVTCASGYRADLGAVPYLAGVLDRVSVTDGFPDLSPGFETTLPGLFVTGFASTRDFGPFYGFTKGCPSSARIAVDEMLR